MERSDWPTLLAFFLGFVDPVVVDLVTFLATFGAALDPFVDLLVDLDTFEGALEPFIAAALDPFGAGAMDEFGARVANN